MASEKKFTQICPLWTNKGLVLYALDATGRVWRLGQWEERWVGLPIARQEAEVTKGPWSSTARRPMEWLGGSAPQEPDPSTTREAV